MLRHVRVVHADEVQGALDLEAVRTLAPYDSANQQHHDHLAYKLKDRIHARALSINAAGHIKRGMLRGAHNASHASCIPCACSKAHA